ncbi:MAG: glutamate--tRNA ligase [Gemmatimonadetes bacterium]|nr:glutamate--tRNA ligase [Gemmatimonadota bacterium]
MTDAPRVRFAPSPTGYLHVGGARTALFNWLYARGQGGTFVLRIEDTDRQRSSDEMTQAILDGMQWLGLEWDEGPYHQADGFDRHRADAERLLERGLAYRCFCTPEELQAKRDAAGDEYRYDRKCVALSPADVQRRLNDAERFTVRFLVPEGETEWDDAVHGRTSFQNSAIDDFIVLRSDATPIYNLAVVSDDIDMRITHVIRGDDHLSNTPRQILLYRALDAEVPIFAHLPMILGPDGKRLSKRHGATAVGEYAERGILPTALANFLALLGWNPGDDQEIMLIPELIARFSLERVNKKSAIFDPDKLDWMNAQHVIRMSGAELLPIIAPALIAEGLTTEQEVQDREGWFHSLMELLKPRAHGLGGFADQARAYLAPAVEYESAGVAKHWKDPAATAAGLQEVGRLLATVEPWEAEALEAALRKHAERSGVAFGKIVHPLRLALTGSTVSPGIHEVLAHMGPQLVHQRLRAAVAVLTEQKGAEMNIDTYPPTT